MSRNIYSWLWLVAWFLKMMVKKNPSLQNVGCVYPLDELSSTVPVVIPSMDAVYRPHKHSRRVRCFCFLKRECSPWDESPHGRIHGRNPHDGLSIHPFVQESSKLRRYQLDWIRTWPWTTGVPTQLPNQRSDRGGSSRTILYSCQNDFRWGKTNLSHDGLNPAHVPFWRVNNPTLIEFCYDMIGRADIEGSKSNVAVNAWLPQASYPCGNFSDT